MKPYTTEPDPQRMKQTFILVRSNRYLTKENRHTATELEAARRSLKLGVNEKPS